MSRSDWRPLAKVVGLGLAGLGAAFFILFVGYTLGASAGYFDTEAKGYAAQYPHDTDQRVDRCFAEAQPLGEVKDCVELAIGAGRESARAEEDLSAQQEMAYWAWWLLMVTMAQLPFTAVGMLFLLRTIWQAQEALEQARITAKDQENLGKAQVRAYISVELPMLDVSDVMRPSITFHYSNSGQSPARHLEFEAMFVVVPHGTDRPIINLSSGCNMRGDFRVGARDEAKLEWRNKHLDHLLPHAIEEGYQIVVQLVARFEDVFREHQTERFDFWRFGRFDTSEPVLMQPLLNMVRTGIIRDGEGLPRSPRGPN